MTRSSEKKYVDKASLRKIIKELEFAADNFDAGFKRLLFYWAESENGKIHKSFDDFFKKHSRVKINNDKDDKKDSVGFKLFEPFEGSGPFVDFFNTYASTGCYIKPVQNNRDVGYLMPFSAIDLVNRFSWYTEEYIKLSTPGSFDYYSKEFRDLRHKVFLRDGEKCAKCKKIPRPGVVLTIDHIKPASKFPELSLKIDNLQVLCWECNKGKSNINYTDYRDKNGN